MKRKMLIFITAILIAVLFAGCGNKVKNEEDLLVDLVADSSFYMVEGSEVTELSIIKRLTDEENKTDKVYVSINIDHEAATATQAYIMYYTCYNEGWLLDDIEEYYGDEVEWTTVPKGAPTNEQIMEALIAYSNSQIDASYADQYISEELTHTYFFEEGKYATTIYTGEFIAESEYKCIVETERVFEYIEVSETQLLRFAFDYYTYEWYLYDDEILWIYGRPYIDGTWLVPTSGATIQFDFTRGGPGTHTEYDAVCSIDDEILEYSFRLPIPSTKSIDASWDNIGDIIWGPVSLYIEVAPDMIWCYDNLFEYGFPLEPIELEDEPTALETTGIVDMTIDEEAEAYQKMAIDVFNSVFVEPNVEYIEEVWHPTVNRDYLDLTKETILSGEYQALSMTHMYTQVATADNPEAQETFEDLRASGLEAEEIAVSVYYLEMMSGGEIEYDDVRVMFAKQGEQIYVIIVG